MDGEVSANIMQVLLTSLKTMNNLIGNEELESCTDETSKIDLNGHQMMVMGAIDKQQKFHPVGFVLKSHGDEDSCQCGFDKLKDKVSEKLGIALAPWRSREVLPAVPLPGPRIN